ncbi:MAG: 16S rRNA (uracil(1498)-N(3))-methyltransferase [Treponema sp.]|nr:16S rRNA (uracil(1498)-N(3))-methyltransferase [Treponema sp.]
MKQFIINGGTDSDNLVRFEGKDYHYLVNVRRYAAGEYFPALLPNNKETLVHIISISNGVITGKCIPPSLSHLSSSSPALQTEDACLCAGSSDAVPPIILFQALPKSDKMDLIVRQAAEGGITEIVPFVSEFTIGRTKAAGQKFSRWERIIKEARQQSGSRIATALRQPLTINELLDYWKTLINDSLQKQRPGLGILFHHLQERAGGLEHESLHRYLVGNPEIIVLAIGPEGGFSDKEVSLFLENGFKPFTIGDIVLRTETAALYCAAAIRILLLERDSWELKKV